MTFEEIKQWIEANKETVEVKSYVDSFKVEPTLEVFKEKIITDNSFTSFMDSEKDKHLTKGIETFKSNHLEKLVDAQIKERFPEQDPKDVQISEMNQRIDKMQKDSDRKELTNLALKTVTDKKLPTELVDLLVSSDETTTLKNIESFETIFRDRMENMVTEKMKNSSYEPPSDDTKFDSITKDIFLKMNYSEQQEFAEQKPDAFNSMLE